MARCCGSTRPNRPPSPKHFLHRMPPSAGRTVDAPSCSMLATCPGAQEKAMAEEARGDGQTDAPPTPLDAPQLIVNAQYIKDFSFENPRAPQILIQQGAQPSVD